MSDMQIEMLAEEHALVGEGPVWDPKTSVLYWTDIRGGRYFKYDPATGVNETIHNGIFVGGAAVNRTAVSHSARGKASCSGVPIPTGSGYITSPRCAHRCSSTM